MLNRMNSYFPLDKAAVHLFYLFSILNYKTEHEAQWTALIEVTIILETKHIHGQNNVKLRNHNKSTNYKLLVGEG